MRRFLLSKAVAFLGTYFTPRRAIGIKEGMMMALKMMAERIALCGEASLMMFRVWGEGKKGTKSAGRMAKYLAMSLAILKVVRVPLVIRICFPTSKTSISLVGLESRS